MLDEAKDPAIKLFGKTISLPETPVSADVVDYSGGGGADDDDKDLEIGCSKNVSDVEGTTEAGNRKKAELEDAADTHSEVQLLTQNLDEFTHQTTASALTKNPSPDSEVSTVQQSSNTEDEENNKSRQSGPQDKTLKKPDKILPCPRCSSMETKFCYFNNYNVNQPRHFCKNCQRYWTAGGTMRNVPVGAGRRKSKSTASQYRHIVVSESLQNGGGDLHNRPHYPGPRPANGALLAFGSDNPMGNSVTSILNLVENGIHNPDRKLTSPLGTKDIDGAVSSVETESKPGTKEQGESDNVHVYPPPVPCFPGAPWPYPWNSAQWSPQLPNPGFNSSGFPLAFYPPGAYWGCSVPGTWAIPWTPPPQSNSPKGSNSGSCPNSPTILGKHSRDGNILRSNGLDEGETLKDSKPERCLWIPKTLRIDDPEQAAKSSIWTTLGIKSHKPDSACGSGMFRARFFNMDEKNRFIDNARALDVNPAAMSRSQAFNEAL